MFVSDSQKFYAYENFLLFGIRAAFNILSHPLTYIMYFITENEAPPPNVPLSGSPYQLSKSILEYFKVMTLAVDSMHNQMT